MKNLKFIKKGSCNALLLFLMLTIFAACATYQDKVAEPRNLLKAGQTSEALAKLQELAAKPGGDQLVYQLDYATALQVAGQYRESSQAFIKADKLVDLNDYHSISNVVGAALGGEESVQYKGESFEKFLINTMNAINFLMMGQYDDALVEARRINEKINKMKMDGREPYEQSPFARYLASLLWEASGNMDSAYIELEATYKLDPNIPNIRQDLVRMAKKSRREDAFKKWKKEFPEVKEDPQWSDRNRSELIVIFQQGWGPQKKPRPNSPRFPKLSPVHSEVQSARILIDGEKHTETSSVYNIEKVAIDTLEKDYGSLVARRVGGIVAKEVVADQIRQKDELLGAVAWIVMHASDRADLRQWSTLPKSIQIARIPVRPGKYNVTVESLGFGSSMESKVFEKVEFKPGRLTFLNSRSLR
jgi:hypothetical protein